MTTNRRERDRLKGRAIELIGVACGLGGADRSCAEAPARLEALGLAERLRDRGLSAAWGPALAPRPGPARRAVSELCARLASRVGEAIGAGRLPCVIGGDHACAAGTWAGAARALDGPLGLLWIDAHLDSHTPGTSPSGRLHGMPLAALLGEADEPSLALGGGPLRARHVCLVGARSFEPEEAQLLAQRGVRVFPMEEIRQRGLEAVMADALAIVTAGTAGFGVTIDLDVLDPTEAPGVATPAPAGLRSQALLAALAGLAGDSRLVGFELAEYSPVRDPGGQTGRLAIQLACAGLSGRYEAPPRAAEAGAGPGLGRPQLGPAAEVL